MPETRHKLLDRSRTVFGRTVDIEADRTARSDTKSSGIESEGDKEGGKGGEKENDKDGDAYRRRRAQILRAQRSHRNRKENYLRNLEQEVCSLRKQREEEKGRAQTRIRILKNTIISHGLPLPNLPLSAESSQADLSSPEGQAPSEDMVTIAMDDHHSYMMQGRQLHATLPSYAGSSSASNSGGDFMAAASYQLPEIGEEDGFGIGSDQANSWLQMQAQGQSPEMKQPDANVAISQLHHANQDAISCGLDFILNLEHFCFSMHPGILLPSASFSTRGDGTGHTHLVTSQLLGFAPEETAQRAFGYKTNSFTTMMTPAAESFSWTVSMGVINRILALSTSLPMYAGELTPAQVWARVVNTSDALAYAKIEDLKTFTDNVFKTIKCRGFGAVVEEESVDQALRELNNAVALYR